MDDRAVICLLQVLEHVSSTDRELASALLIKHSGQLQQGTATIRLTRQSKQRAAYAAVSMTLLLQATNYVDNFGTQTSKANWHKTHAISS